MNDNLNGQNGFNTNDMGNNFDNNMTNQMNNSQFQFNNVGSQNSNIQNGFNTNGIVNNLENNMTNQMNNSQFQFNNISSQVSNIQNGFNNVGNQVNNPQFPQNNGLGQMNATNNINDLSVPNVGNSSNLSSLENKKFFNNKKLVYIIGGCVLIVIVVLILYFTVFKKDNSVDYNDYDDYEKEQERIKEEINNNFTYKDYETTDGILIELKNNNGMVVDADIKIEFYDAAGTLVDVEDDYMYSIVDKGVGYSFVYVDDELDYSTYKIAVDLNKCVHDKVYNNEVAIVSANAQGDNYLIQIRNDANVNLTDIGIGVLFLDSNNSIIAYKEEYFYDLVSGDTTSGKVSIPYDSDYRGTINYDKVEVKILYAEALVS